MITVFVIDDQELVRAGFTMVVDSQPDLHVVGQAGDGEDAVAQLRDIRCDVVLMDVRMPRLDGVAATERLLAGPHPPRVLMLITFDLDEYAYRALRAGASGFLLKDSPPGRPARGPAHRRPGRDRPRAQHHPPPGRAVRPHHGP